MIARAAIALVSLTLLPDLLAAQPVFVEPPVRVSPRGAGPHTWLTASTSPDGERILICRQRNRPDRGAFMQTVLYGSDDGGESWRELLADSVLTSEVSCALGERRRRLRRQQQMSVRATLNSDSLYVPFDEVRMKQTIPRGLLKLELEVLVPRR